MFCVPLPRMMIRARRPYIRAVVSRRGEVSSDPAPVLTVIHSELPDLEALSCTTKERVSAPERESNTMLYV